MATHNLVTQLKSKVFIKAKNLEFINLKKNQIEFIDDDAFFGLHNLKGLYLKYNLISRLSDNTFKHLTKISDFDLIHFSIAEKCLNAPVKRNSVIRTGRDIY